MVDKLTFMVLLAASPRERLSAADLLTTYFMELPSEPLLGQYPKSVKPHSTKFDKIQMAVESDEVSKKQGLKRSRS